LTTPEDSPRRILVVVGTRPEAIKMAPVVAALSGTPGLDSRLVLTGQHERLVDQILDLLDLRPDYDLGIMREGQSLYDVARECLQGLGGVVQEYRPDLVLAQGDTATVFFSSLVAFFEKTRVGHVEAGLRSGDKWAPFPEEIFRRLTDVLTDLHFTPTTAARDNLLAEGVDPLQVHVTGNTVVDSLMRVASMEGDPEAPALRSILQEGGSRLVLLTAHRRESFGEPLRDVFGAVRRLVDEHADVRLLYPVHPNPNVLEPARELLSDHPRIDLIEPLGYRDLVLALQGAHLILTDSGGIQEEAPTFGTPVLVLRRVTERPEGVEAGVATLVGTDSERILAEGRKVLSTDRDGARSSTLPNPYGDGAAGERIADIIASVLTGSARSTTDWAGP
jgi:UDP-N-acetylglucosamine 2-epimerase (non-hydrolysing)